MRDRRSAAAIKPRYLKTHAVLEIAGRFSSRRDIVIGARLRFSTVNGDQPVREFDGSYGAGIRPRFGGVDLVCPCLASSVVGSLPLYDCFGSLVRVLDLEVGR